MSYNYNEADHPRNPAGSPNGKGGEYTTKTTMGDDTDLSDTTTSNGKDSLLSAGIRACLPSRPEPAADGVWRMERLDNALKSEAWAQYDRRTLAYGDPCYRIDDGLYLDAATFDALPPLEQERYRAWACGADLNQVSDDAWNDFESMQYVAADAYAMDDEEFYHTDADPGYFEKEMERFDVPPERDLDRMGVDRNAFAEAFDTVAKNHPLFQPAIGFDDEFAFEDAMHPPVTPRRMPDGSWRLYDAKQLKPFAIIPRLTDDPREYDTMCAMMRRALGHMNG